MNVITVADRPYTGTWESLQCKMSRNVKQRTFGQVRPAKIQISLRIRAVWSESSPGAFWYVATDAKFLHADNDDSDQTTRMHRWLESSMGAHVRSYVLSWCGSNVVYICCLYHRPVLY